MKPAGQLRNSQQYHDWRNRERFEDDTRLILERKRKPSHDYATLYEAIVNPNPARAEFISSWDEHHKVPWSDCAGKTPEELVEFLETQRAIWLVKASA